MRRKHWQTGQHFHLYLIAYGLFRFAHEFLRATPKPFLGLSGYQIIGIATAVAAIVAYRKRMTQKDIIKDAASHIGDCDDGA